MHFHYIEKILHLNKLDKFGGYIKDDVSKENAPIEKFKTTVVLTFYMFFENRIHKIPAHSRVWLNPQL